MEKKLSPRSSVFIVMALGLISSGGSFATTPNLDKEQDQAQAEAWFQELTQTPSSSAGKYLDLSVGRLGKKGCFPEAELELLCKLPLRNVESLHIYRDGCKVEEQLTSAALKSIGACLPSLKLLDADANRIDSFAGIAEAMPSLRHLKAIFNDQLANADLSPLADLPDLRSLNLQGVPLSVESLRTLRSPSLQYIRIDAPDLDANPELDKSYGLTHLGDRLPSLKSLQMNVAVVSRPLLEELLQHPGLLEPVLFTKKGVLNVPSRWEQEAADWMQNESSGLLIHGEFSKDQLNQALQARPDRNKVLVQRALDAEETTQLLSKKIDQVVISSGSTDLDIFLESAATLNTPGNLGIGVSNFVFKKSLVEFATEWDEDGKPTTIVSYVARLKAALPAAKLKTFVLKSGYEYGGEWSTIEVIVKDL